MRKHAEKFVRYFLVGGAATVLDWTIFAIFAIWLSFDYLLVGGVGFLFAAGFNYLLSIKYVFRSGARFSGGKELMVVYMVSAVGLVLHEIILLSAHEYLGLQLMLCKVLATALVLFWNFGVRNFYVFARPRARE